MPIKYEYKFDGDDLIECDCCGSKAPVFLFDNTRNAETHLRGHHHFCEICASSKAGNSYCYPQQYGDANVLQHVAFVGNLILDKVLNRRPPDKGTPNA